MDGDYYSTGAQVKRELRGRSRRLGLADIGLGAIIAIGGFYLLRRPGESQVYDVRMPYVLVSIYLVYLVFSITHPERVGRTAALFHNFPRDRKIVLAADLIFSLCCALYLELIVAAGIWLKLGGADITPYYRLHPHLVALPVIAVFGSIWYCGRPRTALHAVVAVFLLVALLSILFAVAVTAPRPSIENNFLPPRVLPLTYEWLAVIALLAPLAIACWHIKDTLYPLGETRP